MDVSLLQVREVVVSSGRRLSLSGVVLCRVSTVSAADRGVVTLIQKQKVAKLVGLQCLTVPGYWLESLQCLLLALCISYSREHIFILNMDFATANYTIGSELSGILAYYTFTTSEFMISHHDLLEFPVQAQAAILVIVDLQLNLPVVLRNKLASQQKINSSLR